MYACVRRWHRMRECSRNNAMTTTRSLAMDNATCHIEPGFSCMGQFYRVTHACPSVATDGVLAPGIDDSNTVSGDGRAGDCTHIEDGFMCAGGGPISADSCTPCRLATCNGPQASDCRAAQQLPFFNPGQGTSRLVHTGRQVREHFERMRAL